jgi:speckle-type POZ protein
MGDFTYAIIDAYACSSKEDIGLRDIVVEVAHSHLGSLVRDEDFAEVLERSDCFSADLV